jgi:hypothetical protein
MHICLEWKNDILNTPNWYIVHTCKYVWWLVVSIILFTWLSFEFEKLENNVINNVTHGAYNQKDQTWFLFTMDQIQNKYSRTTHHQ